MDNFHNIVVSKVQQYYRSYQQNVKIQVLGFTMEEVGQNARNQ